MAPVSAIVEGPETARVPFPPPLAFIGALGLGFALHHLVPVRLVRSGRAIDALELAGVLLVLAAVALALWAFACFRLAGTSPLLERPATALVVRGPFRFTRNPLYLAMALVHAGVSLFSNALFPLLLLAPAMLAVSLFAIAREERYLLERFGADYDAYRRSVRRWI